MICEASRILHHLLLLLSLTFLRVLLCLPSSPSPSPTMAGKDCHIAECQANEAVDHSPIGFADDEKGYVGHNGIAPEELTHKAAERGRAATDK